MNIFVLDNDPIVAAQSVCNKHVVKMIIESGQMLSTAHRVLDGTQWTDYSKNGRKIKRWKVDDDREDYLWKASFVGHPCTVWTMANEINYTWHWQHAYALCKEYTERYGKVHSSEDLIKKLRYVPNALSVIFPHSMTNFAQAMPDKYKVKDNAVQAYRNYYNGEKGYFAKWPDGKTPDWWDPVQNLMTV